MAKKKKGTPLLQKVQEEGKMVGVPGNNQDRIKILGWGATPYVITGFGVVMRKILHSLYRMYPGKYDISMVGINHLGDFYDEIELTGGFQNGRFKQWPAMQFGGSRANQYGQHKFLSLIDTLNPFDFDLVFLFEDPFWVGGDVPNAKPITPYIDAIKGKMAARGKGHLPIVAYFPIDGIPKEQWVKNIAKIDIPITYLNFGKQACIEVVPELQDRLQIIPHGVDMQEFYPVSDTEKRVFRRAMFGDEFVDKFMFINVNRNQLRKLVPSTLIAFKRFQELTNNAGVIYLNMRAVDVGWNLVECCKMLGLTPGVDVLFPPNFNVQKGLTLEELNKVFSSADVLLSTAVGGGWELAITQAFASKTAVIAPANTSHIELLGDQEDEESQRGLLYKAGETLSQRIIFPNDNEVLRPLPDLDDMVDKMIKIYEDTALRNKLQDNAYDWVESSLSWERDVVPKFDYLFTVAKRNRELREGAASPVNIKPATNVQTVTVE